MENLEQREQMKLWNHQIDAVKAFETREGYCLWHEMGTGKTGTAITIYNNIVTQALQNSNTIPALLILCPSITLENWKREFNTFAPHLYNQVQVLHGEGKKRIQSFKVAWNKGFRIFITNHEALSMPTMADLFNRNWDMLIVDESHRFKGATNLRSKAIHRLADRCKYKLLLSGSPVLNSYEDIWSQLRILGANIVGANFYAWRKRYFKDINADKSWVKFPTYVPTKEAIPYFQMLMSEYGSTVKKADVLDLPPLVKQNVYVDLLPEVARHYHAMEKDFITILNDDVCAADLVVTKILRLQQICCGLVRGEDDNIISTAKHEVLREYLEELCKSQGNKVIVWCNWIAPLKQIKKLCEDIGLGYSVIEGGQNVRDRQDEVDRFNTNALTQVCIANQAAGGVGIGLQAASYMIYFSKGYSLEQNIQSEARAYRGGSEIHQSITRIDILTRETIEEDIHEALEGKFEMAELVTKLKQKYATNK